MRIVALLGNTPDLNHEPERRSLNSLRPVADLVFPKNLDDVINELSHGCDILYFGGHGVTRNGKGSIQFNGAWIESEFFAGHLIEAVSKGLKLAIFISCEGIGLLEDFHTEGVRIPFVIVMTGAILDEAAGKFVEVFFDNYTRGLPFINSFDAARNALRIWDRMLPGISNLPIVYQDFNAPDLPPVPWYIPIYKFLQDIIPNRQKRRFWKRRKYQLALVLLVFFLILALCDRIFIRNSDILICPSFIHKDNELKEYLSVGGNDLLNEDTTIRDELAQGFKSFQNGCDQLNRNSVDRQQIQDNFNTAFKIFDKYKSKAPDYYVYSQNARVYQDLANEPLDTIKNKLPYTIAVSVPRQVLPDKKSQRDTGGEIINGVAAFQYRINNDTNRKKLVLLLADDQGEKSEKVAGYIGNISRDNNLLLGVIGHAQTSATQKAASVYQKQKVILLSPTSTGQIRNNEHKEQDDYIYKVVFDGTRLIQDITKIAEQKSPDPNDKVLLVYSDDPFGSDIQKKFIDTHKEKSNKLISKKLDEVINLNNFAYYLEQENIKVIIIDLSVDARNSWQFSKILGILVNNFLTKKKANKTVVFSDTFYNSRNLEDIKEKGLCDNPNLELVTPAWVNTTLDKKIKEDLPKSSTELYSWRIDFAFDAALILMSAAQKVSNNNLSLEALKNHIKTEKVNYLLYPSLTGLEDDIPAFDSSGNRNVDKKSLEETSQVWTTRSQNGEKCQFVQLK